VAIGHSRSRTEASPGLAGSTATAAPGASCRSPADEHLTGAHLSARTLLLTKHPPPRTRHLHRTTQGSPPGTSINWTRSSAPASPPALDTNRHRCQPDAAPHPRPTLRAPCASLYRSASKRPSPASGATRDRCKHGAALEPTGTASADHVNSQDPTSAPRPWAGAVVT
jgi:hypothetical protein